MVMLPTATRKAGWLLLLAVALVALFALSLNVNALRSKVRITEAEIIKIKRETNYYETEFETLANQQHLRAWNDLEFGFSAPNAQQYLAGERALAALGQSRAAGAPRPVRVVAATSDEGVGGVQSDRVGAGQVALSDAVADAADGSARSQAVQPQALQPQALQMVSPVTGKPMPATMSAKPAPRKAAPDAAADLAARLGRLEARVQSAAEIEAAEVGR